MSLRYPYGLKGCRATVRTRYPLQPTHVRPEHFRHQYRTVRLLIVLQHCDPRPADREARSVQGMNIFRLRTAIATESYLGTSSLKRFVVGARRNLAEGVLRWQPHFYV